MEYLVATSESLVNLERWNLNKAVPTAIISMKRLLGNVQVSEKTGDSTRLELYEGMGWMGRNSEGVGMT